MISFDVEKTSRQPIAASSSTICFRESASDCARSSASSGARLATGTPPGMQKGFSHDRGGPYNAPGSPKDIGNVTAGNFTIPDDQGGAWFFALTAYDTEIPSLES
jgi:hypothetical protein